MSSLVSQARLQVKVFQFANIGRSVYSQTPARLAPADSISGPNLYK